MSAEVNPTTGRTCPFVDGDVAATARPLGSVRVAVAGKGGAGKTTIAGTLARALAQRGRTVLAVDADTNPNLSVTLGVPAERATAITSLPRTLIERRPQADGTTKPVFVADPIEVLQQYGADAPDGVRLLVMGAVGHGGAGWMCGAHATVRGLLGELVTRPALADRDLVVDMEAGLEHLSRGTGRHVSSFLAVLEPYFRSMETVRRISDLAAELGVADVQVVVNKVRTPEDRVAIAAFCETHRLSIAAEIPFDPALADAERGGHPPIDATPHSPAVSAICELADRLAGHRI